ncbi:hypothetical protein [Lentilactobacillus farraginis]|nr:hypothetical protein [Lentilactobacillus farraginis]
MTVTLLLGIGLITLGVKVVWLSKMTKWLLIGLGAILMILAIGLITPIGAGLLQNI